MAVLEQYTYIFVIGTFFALLDAYNNGASTWPSPVQSGDTEQRQTMSPTPGLPVFPRGLSRTGKP